MRFSRAPKPASRRSRLVRLTGELHNGTVATARRSIWPDLQRSVDLIVDLEKVSFIDSAGLGFLLSVNREVARQGGRWALVGASAAVVRLLAVTQADRLLPLYVGLAEVEQAWSEGECPETWERERTEGTEPARTWDRLT